MYRKGRVTIPVRHKKERDGWKHCILGRGIPYRAPWGSGYRVKCFTARKELCAEGVNMWAKGESPVKGYAKELGGRSWMKEGW